MVSTFPHNNKVVKGGIGYKKWGKEISLADLALRKSLEHNRSLKMMNGIERVVSGGVLMERFEIGTTNEGADAYPALMLLKGCSS